MLHYLHVELSCFSCSVVLNVTYTIRYDTIEFNVDSKAEYSALSSTRNLKLKQTKPVPL